MESKEASFVAAAGRITTKTIKNKACDGRRGKT
jgi:hypothetical protein